MPALDFEVNDIEKLFSEKGITKDRCLLTIKRGWITISVDNRPVIEFNRKKAIYLDSKGTSVNTIEYKWKENGQVKKSYAWTDAIFFFKNKISTLF